MEKHEELELTEREDGLRELRGVLSTPHRRSSRKSSINSLMMGGTVGVLALVGAGGYYGLNVLFPSPTQHPVRVSPDRLVEAETPPEGVDAPPINDIKIAAEPIENTDKFEESTQIETAERVEAPQQPQALTDADYEAPVIASIEPVMDEPELQQSPAPLEVASVLGEERAGPAVEPVVVASLSQDAPTAPLDPAEARGSSPIDATRLSADAIAKIERMVEAPAPAEEPEGAEVVSLSTSFDVAEHRASPSPTLPQASAAVGLNAPRLSTDEAGALARAPAVSGLPQTPTPAAIIPRPNAGTSNSGAGIGRTTQQLSAPPAAQEALQVASLGDAPREAPGASAINSPAWSPVAPSAMPNTPEIPRAIGPDRGQSETRQVSDILVPGLLAPLTAIEPRAPQASVVASLSTEINSPALSAAAPVSTMAPTSLAEKPSAADQIGDVEVALVDEASPAMSLTDLAPHALAADGASQTTAAALRVAHPGAAADGDMAWSTLADEPARTAPVNAAPVATSVQVASISPDLLLALGAPLDSSPTALSAPVDSVTINGLSAGLQTTAPNSAAPLAASIQVASVSPDLPRGAPLEPAPGAFSAPAAAIGVRREPSDLLLTPPIAIAPEIIKDEPIRVASLDPIISDWENAALASRLIDPTPAFDLPSTPNVTVDPSAAFTEPLDALTATAASRVPASPASASVAALGAPTFGMSAPSNPTEPGAAYRDDQGRLAALRAVTAPQATAEVPVETWVDERPAWIRNGVAPQPNPKGLPVMAIVIDEVGAYGAPVEVVRSMSPMVTTSVIPSTPNAENIARNLQLSRREVLVHLPMEASGKADLGPRPILTGMSTIQVQETAWWHMTRFDGYVGVNTHRGGVATRDRRVMEAIMPLLSEQGLIFLDSRNAKDSVAEDVAKEAGLLAAGNNFFIDDKTFTSAIYRQLDAAAAHAKRHGGAIAIGNPHEVTIQAVKAWMKKHDGVKVMVQPLTHVTQVLNGRRGDEIIVAGTPPKRPPPPVNVSEVAGKLSESASQSITDTLSGIAADISERLFNR